MNPAEALDTPIDVDAGGEEDTDSDSEVSVDLDQAGLPADDPQVQDALAAVEADEAEDELVGECEDDGGEDEEFQRQEQRAQVDAALAAALQRGAKVLPKRGNNVANRLG